MKKVYICSPCRGDYENNIQRAKEFSRAAADNRNLLRQIHAGSKMVDNLRDIALIRMHLLLCDEFLDLIRF